MWHHGREEDLPIHRAFFESMAEVTVDEAPPPVVVAAVTGRDDESVPFRQVEERWRAWKASGALDGGSRFGAVGGGVHGLLGAGDVLEAEVTRRLTG